MWWLIVGEFVTGVVRALGSVLALVAIYCFFFGSERAQGQVACALSAAYDLNVRCAYGRMQINGYASFLLKSLGAISAAGVTPWSCFSKLLGLRA